MTSVGNISIDPRSTRGIADIPTLGRIVIYTSKIDNGPGCNVTSPAVVIGTQATRVPEVIDRWGSEPSEVGPSPVDGRTHSTSSRPPGVLSELPDMYTIDLLVHGLGQSYREYAVRAQSICVHCSVAYDDGECRCVNALGTWHWPTRAVGGYVR